MVQSLNTKSEYVVDATSYLGLYEYGQIMIGDKGFEFYNKRDTSKFIQIPWEEVDYVVVSLLFKGKYIPRYAIRTKNNGTYSFSSKKPKELLRAINKHIDDDHIVRSLSFFQVIRRGIKNLFIKQKN
ncbi:MAG: DUF956 family protein [Thomasclavelia sp.]|jgi:hypothetical protein|nr:DUF956 family protein [Thomasclavelia sp.]